MIEEEPYDGWDYGEADPKLVEWLIETLELELEWGVEFDSHLGRLTNAYSNRAVARAVLEECFEEVDNAKLVHRYVGRWKEVNE